VSEAETRKRPTRPRKHDAARGKVLRIRQLRGKREALLQDSLGSNIEALIRQHLAVQPAR
jgi:hypothetical protein